MIRTGAFTDATDILRVISQSRVDYVSVLETGTLGLQDEYGNVTESKVINLIFHRETIERINWDNFRWIDIADIADSGKVWRGF